MLAKRRILKFYQPHMGKQKPKHLSIIARSSTKAVDSLYARICLRTSNLLDWILLCQGSRGCQLQIDRLTFQRINRVLNGLFMQSNCAVLITKHQSPKAC